MSDAHVAFRKALLQEGTTLPAPSVDQAVLSHESVHESLKRNGLALVELGQPMADERFIEFGSGFGELIPERDPSVQPFVSHGVVLNLTAERGRTKDVSLQPFSVQHLSLHSEGSGRRAAEQPRYIALMCCDPGPDPRTAQTVLIRMAEVARQLDAEDVKLLCETRYLRNTEGPHIARRVDGRVIFSFRDFVTDKLEWVHTGHERDPERVDEAIRRLLAAMYRPAAAWGTQWKRGQLLIIDNTFFFHGRTSGHVVANTRRRHLKRLRII